MRTCKRCGTSEKEVKFYHNVRVCASCKSRENNARKRGLPIAQVLSTKYLAMPLMEATND